MPQVQNQYKAGRKPFDTNVQLQRNGKELYLLLPSRKKSRNYWTGAGGLLLAALYGFVRVTRYEGGFFILALALAIVLTVGAFLMIGIGAFMQVGLYSDGRKIRLLKKIFNYPIQTVENVAADFESVDLLCNNPEEENGEIEIVVSFSSGVSFKFGAELSDEEQNWLVTELTDYVTTVRGQSASRHITTFPELSSQEAGSRPPSQFISPDEKFIPPAPAPSPRSQKPFDTDVHLQREGNNLHLLLPTRNNKVSYRAWGFGLGLLILVLLLNVVDDLEDGQLEVNLFLFVPTLLLAIGGAMVVGVKAFMQVELQADGHKISLHRKFFEIPVQEVERPVSDFASVEVRSSNPEKELSGVELVLSFSSHAPFKFGGGLSDEEQIWLVDELTDYLESVRGESHLSQVPA